MLLRRLRAPGNLALAYLLVTWALFWFGPVKWKVHDPTLLNSFVFAAVAAFFIGSRIASDQRAPGAAAEDQRVPTVLFYLGCAALIATGIGFLQAFFGGDVLGALRDYSDPGSAYMARVRGDQSTTEVNRFVQFATLAGGLRLFIIPILILYWKKLTRFQKTLGITCQLLAITPYLLGGTLIGLFTPLLSLAVTFLAVRAATPDPFRWRRVYPVFGIILLFLTIFGFMQAERARIYGTEMVVVPRYFASYDPKSMEPIPDPIAGTLVVASMYVTLGYEGLSGCLELPFVWTYGIGHSVGATQSYTEYIGRNEIFDSTYLARNERATGWPALMYWSTAWAWWAGDATFYGAILLTGLAAWIWSRCWVSWMANQNLYALVCFIQFTVLVVFLPANNQIFQNRQSLFSTIFVVAAAAYSIRLGSRAARSQPGIGQIPSPSRSML